MGPLVLAAGWPDVGSGNQKNTNKIQIQIHELVIYSTFVFLIASITFGHQENQTNQGHTLNILYFLQRFNVFFSWMCFFFGQAFH